MRDYDPGSPGRRAFKGIDATPYDPRWSLEGHFTPYGEHRTVRVENADGRHRWLGLGGVLAFTLDGQDLTLQVSVEDDGSLWAVFADSTSGEGSYPFRFLRPPAPDAEGRTAVDFNRALLPPCAFADHFVCPFPPPGNSWPPRSRRGSGPCCRRSVNLLVICKLKAVRPKAALAPVGRTAEYSPSALVRATTCPDPGRPSLAAPHGPQPHVAPDFPWRERKVRIKRTTPPAASRDGPG